MNYEHPLKYAGILDCDSAQGRAKLMVEENCLKCENFMGQEHDFSNCNFKEPCFVGFKFPSILNYEDFIKFKSVDVATFSPLYEEWKYNNERRADDQSKA